MCLRVLTCLQSLQLRLGDAGLELLQRIVQRFTDGQCTEDEAVAAAEPLLPNADQLRQFRVLLAGGSL